MKRTKKQIGLSLLEGLGELLLTLLCFGIGALIVSLFGVDIFAIDSDLLVLLGTAVFIAVFVAVYFLIQWIKRSR